MNLPVGRTQIPDGVRDRLPREAGIMRRLCTRLDDIFAMWGYRTVVTPGFEYLETVTAGAGSQGRREDLYQFFDRKGRTLALRADMTTPIARLAASKMAGEPLPLRLSYSAAVYRHRDRKAGSAHEIWQAGIELIGAPGAAADAEVIALACAALAQCGLDGVKIGLGHVEFVEGIFAEAGLEAGREADLREALVARNLVAFEKGVADAGLPPDKADLLLGMVHFSGSHEQAVRQFSTIGNSRVERALTEWGTQLALLKEFGVADQVSLDPGLARSFGYYTGVVFEGYAPGVGAPLTGGGRYDLLLTDFGGNAAATGFALELDRLMGALERQDALPGGIGLDVVVACPPGSEAQAMAAARSLRAQGLTVEVDLLGRSGDALKAYAGARGALRIVQPEDVEKVRPMSVRPRPSGVPSIH